MNIINKSMLSIIFMISTYTNHSQILPNKVKIFLGLTTVGIITRYSLPPAYRLAKNLNFKVMSFEKRLKHAYPFYLKLAQYYYEAISKQSRNEADLQTIVATGYRISHTQTSIGKQVWQFFDFEQLNSFKKREKLAKYPFLYYENKLKADIKLLEYYINHLQVDGPHAYAQKKQEMRNLLGELKRLLVEIQRSYTYEHEHRKYQEDKQATHLQTAKVQYAYNFKEGK